MPSDTLAQVAQELGDLRRRLRFAQASALRQVNGVQDDSVPGLRLSAVSESLVDYFGEGSEDGLLVLEADERWSPIKAGDVLLKVGAEFADATQLRAVLDAKSPVSVELLRRKRPMAVLVKPR